jgi:hypothetical protein
LSPGSKEHSEFTSSVDIRGPESKEEELKFGEREDTQKAISLPIILDPPRFRPTGLIIAS